MASLSGAASGGSWDAPTLAKLPPAAVVHRGVRLTSEEVAARSAAVAAGLAQRGAGPGRVVAFQLPNWWEAVALFHACWRLGAVAAPLHHRLVAAEVAELVERLDPAVVLQPGDARTVDGAIGVRGPDDGFTALATARRPGADHEVQVDALAVILATSGSSGRPKLVHHSHRALAYKAAVMVKAHGLVPTDTVLMPAPLAHISGLLNGVLLPGRGGMTTVLMDRWDPAEALDLVAAESVSFMIGPPTFFLDLLEEPQFSPERTSSLRLVSSGGASISPSFVEEASERLEARVKRTYGSTEAPTVTTWHEGDPPERASTTDGRAVGDAAVRITDPESGDVVGSGTSGEIQVRGPELFVGYDDQAMTARAVTDDGWFRTGDHGHLDDGWLVVEGRLGALIIRGGENVSPAEVESVCASIAGVRQAVVVGYPDPRLGERIGLVVVGEREPSVDEVRAHCEQAGLARYKTPERVLRLEKIPVLAAGKPDRALLGERIAAER